MLNIMCHYFKIKQLFQMFIILSIKSSVQRFFVVVDMTVKSEVTLLTEQQFKCHNKPNILFNHNHDGLNGLSQSALILLNQELSIIGKFQRPYYKSVGCYYSVINMTLFHRFSLCSKFRHGHFQYRQYATTYSKTLNMPVTKFPAYVKQTKRPEHDKQIREVSN